MGDTVLGAKVESSQLLGVTLEQARHVELFLANGHQKEQVPGHIKEGFQKAINAGDFQVFLYSHLFPAS